MRVPLTPIVLTTGLLLVLTCGAGAQSNLTLPPIDPPAVPQTCAAFAALVKSQGAVVVGNTPQTIQRYVKDQAFCAYQQVANPAWIALSDNPQCFVGYTCGDNNDSGSGR
ncbi:hypothetical protein DFO45_2177 [Azorhizobium sp. AG788]|uniref:hypothetical protein n=1 Tax=Azorhizobium sp. AG788 TaxID=2183897 RepID=UPI00105FD0CD|nr:hypothetical protein [Azorhizobium sp. AG788]TDT94431.1 hypothetical protein DFO45_2177 [Azorhizobium sp. AG788]